MQVEINTKQKSSAQKRFREDYDNKKFLTTERRNDIEDILDPYYTWQQKNSLGRFIPRAKRNKKITDKQYLEKIAMRDNTKYLYAQR